MKRKKILPGVALLVAMLLSFCLTGCEDLNVNVNVHSGDPTNASTPTDNSGGSTDPSDPTDPADPTVPTDSGLAERDPKPTDPPKTEDPPAEDPPVADPPAEDPPAGEAIPDPTAEAYKAYLNMSTDAQIAFQGRFSSKKVFLQWYKDAQQAYEDAQHKVTISPGSGLDIGDYIK